MQLKSKRISLKDEIDSFIVNWNNKFPIDRWWREKYKVPFGSEQHKKMDFITMFIDYEEEKLFKKIADSKDPDKTDLYEKSNVVKLSKKEIDDEFENLDINQYADKK